jgi:hypothetical protein
VPGRIGIGPIVEFTPFFSRTDHQEGPPMLRKLAIVMFATTMLAAPSLAADAVKSGAAAAPKAPVTTTNAPVTATTPKTDAGNLPAANGDKTGKDVKTNSATPGATTGTGKNVVTPPAIPVQTIKAEKHLKVVKVAVRHHPHHSHYWYVVHRDRHIVHTMTARHVKPVKHIYVHRLHKEETPVVKANKEVPNKATQ